MPPAGEAPPAPVPGIKFWHHLCYGKPHNFESLNALTCRGLRAPRGLGSLSCSSRIPPAPAGAQPGTQQAPGKHLPGVPVPGLCSGGRGWPVRSQHGGRCALSFIPPPDTYCVHTLVCTALHRAPRGRRGRAGPSREGALALCLSRQQISTDLAATGEPAAAAAAAGPQLTGGRAGQAPNRPAPAPSPEPRHPAPGPGPHAPPPGPRPPAGAARR